MINTNEYHICLPGRIVEFFPETQTATVKICAERSFANSSDDDQLIDRGTIEDVIVYINQGERFCITQPHMPDEPCLLFFSQVGYDHWMWEDKDEAGQVSGRSAPWLKRKFSLADGFCLPGMSTQPRKIAGYDANNLVIRNQANNTGFVIEHSSRNISIITPTDLLINAEDKIETISDNWDVGVGGWATIDVDEDFNLNSLDASVYLDGGLHVGITAVDIFGVAAANVDYDITTAATFDIPTTTWTGDLIINGDLTGTGSLGFTGTTTMTGDCTVTGTLTNAGTTFAALEARVAALETTCAPGCSG